MRDVSELRVACKAATSAIDFKTDKIYLNSDGHAQWQ